MALDPTVTTKPAFNEEAARVRDPQRYKAMKEALENARTDEEKASKIPVIDLQLYKKDPEAWSWNFVDSVSVNGFAIFKNHNMPVEDIEGAYKAVRTLFALPEEEKAKYVIDKAGQRGIGVLGSEQHFSARNTKGDMKEYFMAGREDLSPKEMEQYGIAPNVWPENPPDFREKLMALNDTMVHVQEQVARALAVGLGVKEETFVDMTKHGDTIWRAIHYPALGDVQDKNTGGDRSAEHTDGGLFTLLLSSSQRGLAVLPDRYDESTYLRPPTDPKYMIFNVGRILDRMTKGYLPATWHKVENPEDPTTSRVSVPLFIWPSFDQKIFEIDAPAPVNPSRSQRELTEKLVKDFPVGTTIKQFLTNTLSVQRLARGEKPEDNGAPKM